MATPATMPTTAMSRTSGTCVERGETLLAAYGLKRSSAEMRTWTVET